MNSIDEHLLYQMIYKRKSFHIFTGLQTLSAIELENITQVFKTLKPLVSDIKVDIQIVKRELTSCKRGEYCILLYSEVKDHFLPNIGYIGEQLDLWLASQDIGVCWYGMGKTTEQAYHGLDFVIMLAIEKVDPSEFRKDMFKSKRKNLAEIWQGNDEYLLANIVRFAPSACNTQPWKVVATADRLTVYRYKCPNKRGMMPVARVTYYNRIDIGIFMQFIELVLKQRNVAFERTLFLDQDEQELVLQATYCLKKED